MVHIDEVTKELALPNHLTVEEIDTLIQRIEDAGVSVVGDDGGPTERQLLVPKN